MKEFSEDDLLYLDDLHIGQSFTSGTHVVDEAFEPIWLCDEPIGKLKRFKGVALRCEKTA